MPDGALLHQAVGVSCRPAGERDEAALFDLLLALYDENGFPHPVNEDRVRTMIRAGTRMKGAFIGVIDAQDGGIAASVALVMTQYWYSDDWFLAEQWLFVRPEHRRGGTMTRELFGWSDMMRDAMGPQRGRPWEIISAFWTVGRLAAKLRLWGRFAKQVGGVFVMDGN